MVKYYPFVRSSTHVWQSQVETKHYSIAYLSRSKHYSAELPLRAGLIRTALMHVKSIYVVHVSPAVNGSSALQCFECRKAVENATECKFWT